MTEKRPPPQTPEAVPVVIINWERWDDTLACLRDLRARGDAEDVWVVDNGSRQDRSREVLDLWPGARVLKTGANLGWAGGNNRALDIAAREGFKYCYLLNNDCRVIGPFLRPVVRAARADRRIAAAGSRLTGADGALLFDGRYPRPRGAARVALAQTRKTVVTPYVHGAGMLVRLAAVRRDGAFDERFFCYHEETEWCLRLRRRGWRFVVCRQSVLIHHEHGSDVDSNARYYMLRNFFLLDRLGHPIPGCTGGLRAVIHEAVIAGEAARLSGRDSAWSAIASALHDGQRGRHGPRPARRWPQERLRRDWPALIRRLLREHGR